MKVTLIMKIFRNEIVLALKVATNQKVRNSYVSSFYPESGVVP